MLEINRKQDCCGCAACAQSCPKHCIIMQADEDGFLYPHIDLENCIDCGICERTCPQINKAQSSDMKSQVYVAYNLNEKERLESSSGGIFSLFARQILNDDGVVFGAVMSEDCRSVQHQKIELLNELDSLRGSKYLQSDIGETYVQVKKELDNGRKVLFSGTPCQIGGLKTYLKRDYAALLCVEVVCHGVPSPKLWQKYINFREKRAGATIRRTFFRHKKYGWKMYAVLFEFTNSTAYKQIHYKDLFMQMFLQNLCLRPSCYECHFKVKNGMADISLADCWGAETICPELDDDKGLSLVLVHTNNGSTVFNCIKNNLVKKNVDMDQVIAFNRAIVESCSKPDIRDSFMQDMDCLTIEQLGKKYLQRKPILIQIRIWLSINVKKRLKHILKR